MTALAATGSEADPLLAYHRLRAALTRFGKVPNALNGSERDVVERSALREYALEQRVLGTPEAVGVVITEQAVADSLETIAARYGDGDEFQADLAANGLTERTLRAALWRQLQVEAALERVSSRAARVSDLDVTLYYYLHRERFVQPETRTARHILITVNDDFPENAPAEARGRLQRIRERLLGKPNRFAEQATKHSECPTALHGGLIGRLPRGQLFETVDAALFALGEGELSDIVESPMGFHLVLCERIHAAGPVPLADARPKILARLRERRRKICIRNWLAERALPAGDNLEETA